MRNGVSSMITENKYPILEFDDSRTAKLNPSDVAERPFETNKLVITFFPEVLEKLCAEGKIILERMVGGENLITL